MPPNSSGPERGGDASQAVPAGARSSCGASLPAAQSAPGLGVEGGTHAGAWSSNAKSAPRLSTGFRSPIWAAADTQDEDLDGNPFLTPAAAEQAAKASLPERTDVQSDPFLSRNRTPRALDDVQNVQSDPFLSRNRTPHAFDDVQNDPFLSRSRAPRAVDDSFSARADWTEPEPPAPYPFLTLKRQPVTQRNQEEAPFLTRSFATEPTSLTSNQSLLNGTSQRRAFQDDPFLTYLDASLPLASDPFCTTAHRAEPEPLTSNPFLLPPTCPPEPPLAQRSSTASLAGLTVLRNDPFLSHGGPSLHAATGHVATHEVRRVADLAQDPFFSAASRREADRQARGELRTPGIDSPMPRGRKDFARGGDPFMVHALAHQPSRYLEDVKRDPLLVSHRELPKESAVGKCCRHCIAPLRLTCCLSRPKAELGQVEQGTIAQPWLLFMGVMCCGLTIRHYSSPAYVAAVCLATLGPAAFLAAGLAGWPRARDPLRVKLALLCLAAILAGAGAANLGWDFYARQYWWMWTAQPEAGELTLASTPSQSRTDVAWVRFPDRESAEELLHSDTQADFTRGTGHRAARTYCVAPILSSREVQHGGAILVNYWAIGTDCCGSGGGLGFACDATRKPEAHYGVVMKSQLPCFSCGLDEFQAAIKKAEGLYGLLSSQDAVLVRYVKNPYTMRSDLGWRLLVLVMTAAIAAFFSLTTLNVILHGNRWETEQGGVKAPAQLVRKALG